MRIRTSKPFVFLLGTFLTIQAAANEMKERNIKGSIVMTASMSGSIANKGQSACLSIQEPSDRYSLVRVGVQG
jgi:NAD(P)-dependent dehydrogenase (short-subunit alcohol dehydrogenase family)